MRIVAGKHKGRQFNPPRGFNARPTTDFAKEALFNILVNRIDFSSTRVLDLFAGSGSISYEFCSRGAESIIAVDKNNKNISFISTTFDKLQCNHAQTICADAIRFLNRCNTNCNLVFADPPYDYDAYYDLLQAIQVNTAIDADTLIIIEHSAKMDFSTHQGFIELRKYGSVCFSFFEKSVVKNDE